MGMAVSGLLVSLFSRRIDRGLGILLSLGLLAIPTALLAIASMASAFTLTLAYLGDECSARDAAGHSPPTSRGTWQAICSAV
jgi:YNFM family putative membrane transporter